jgi:hypothetical protein
MSETCPCPGNRQFEPFNREAPEGHAWHVCPCCNARKLIPPLPEETPEEVPE